MHWRAQEFSEIMPDTEWLPEAEAHRVYERVAPLLNRDHYGLDPAAVRGLQRVSADETSREWLTARTAGVERVLLVFRPAEVCRINTSGFLEHWQDLLCPSRDDVVIIGESDGWVLYYYHEEQFEFAETPAITPLQTRDEPRIAAALLILLASGVTLERAVTELPAFKAQIESTFDWMKAHAQCTAAEIRHRADRLREVIHRKEDAIRNQDWDRAAEMRAEECALFESVGVAAPLGTGHSILYEPIDQQMQQLALLLCKNPTT